ncbi:MAG: TetR/AcrR family transcriptional regulator [Polyangiaceae bacterium]
MVTTKKPERRTKRKAPQTRGPAFVEKVLDATLAELVRAGYTALRVDDVAALAGANKTSVYRRWSTKQALVRASLIRMASGTEHLKIPDTGSVREDMRALARIGMRVASSARGRAIMRVLFLEKGDEELAQIGRSIQTERLSVVRQVLDAAVARGELAEDADVDMMVTVVTGTMRDQLLIEGAALDEDFVMRLIDFVLKAVRARPEKLQTSQSKTPAPRGTSTRRRTART